MASKDYKLKTDPSFDLTEDDLDAEYCNVFMKNLDYLRKQEAFCDVALLVEGKTFYCHRILLAAASSYFKQIFQEKRSRKKQASLTAESRARVQIVHVDFISASIVDDLLTYIYTEEIFLREDTAKGLLCAAHLLQIEELKAEVADFLVKRLSPDNSLSYLLLGTSYSAKSLINAALERICVDFKRLVKADALLTLEASVLAQVISRDDLNVSSEEEVFDIVMDWLEYMNKAEERLPALPELLSHIRFGCLSPSYLKTRVAKHKYIKGKQNCMTYVFRAERILEAPEKYLVSELSKPRQSTVEDVIFLTGGTIDKDNHPPLDVSCCYVLSKYKWYRLPSLNIPRFEHGSSSYGCTVYVAGGRSNEEGSILNSVERFDTYKNCWVLLPPMIKGCSGMALAIHQGLLYAIGGESEDCRSLNMVQQYNPISNSWKLSTAMNDSRWAPCAVTSNSSIYVISGENNEGTCLNTAEKFNPVTSKWSHISDMKVGRMGAVAVVLNDKIYVFGGKDFEFISKTEVYDIKTDQWTTVKDMLMPRAMSAVAGFQRYIYVSAGNDLSQFNDGIQYYDVEKDDWKLAGKLPTALEGMKTCSFQMPNSCFQYLEEIE